MAILITRQPYKLKITSILICDKIDFYENKNKLIIIIIIEIRLVNEKKKK